VMCEKYKRLLVLDQRSSQALRILLSLCSYEHIHIHCSLGISGPSCIFGEVFHEHGSCVNRVVL
jgi:hypothetical protein